jgi:phosphohistidine phosphatase
MRTPTPHAFAKTVDVRYLTIVRHAKAAPAKAGDSDYERTLNDRGVRQCEQLRSWALDPEALGRFGPTTALVSGAARTRETFTLAFDQTPLVVEYHFSDLIYNGVRHVSAEDLLIDLAAIDPVRTSLLVVAHNPTVHELLVSLAIKTPKSVLREGYPLGGAFVLALGEDEPIGLGRYELVERYVPD